MHVIGTAGHVDHGKSTLVQALTGINPDRLKEEQEREMTIDLGFAWLTLPSGESVSVVDVPGHEDFVRNMLAGVGGIDAALLVIAADEGVMPQTREHMAILDLLKVQHGVVALTKADLITDSEWIDLIMGDVRALLAPTSLAHAQIVPVSARTRQGLPELLAELDRVLRETPTRRDLGRPRLPVDRVFSMAGFGTVVTGTLVDGRLHTGDEVELVPGGKRARIRGLQSHKSKLETAFPGRRVAVNLVGVSTEEVLRGEVVTHPGWLTATALVDVRVELLRDAPGALGHHAEVELFSGAARVNAHTRILGAEEIQPGAAGWAQLVLDHEIALVKNDRFILRQPSPGGTIGGGTVIEPHPPRKYPRFRPEILKRLETLAYGTPDELLLQSLQKQEPAAARALVRRSNLPEAAAREALEELLQHGSVVALGGGVVGGSAANLSAAALIEGDRVLISGAGWAALGDRLTDILSEYHRAHPLRGGMPREEVKSRLGVDAKLYNQIVAALVQAGRVVEDEARLRLATHQVTLSPAQQTAIEALVRTFERERYTPPSASEAEAQVGAEVLSAAIEQGRLVRVNAEVLYAPAVYGEMVARIREHLESQGSLTVAQVRDLFGASRRYALALMEHLDEQKITRRVGDARVLR